MPADLVDAELTKLAAADKTRTLGIAADKAVPYARVVDLMDRAKRAGFSKVVLAPVVTVHVPPAPPKVDTAKPTLVIVLPVSGDVFIGGKAVSTTDLDKILVAAAKRDPDTQVVITADEKTPYTRVIDLMDRANRAGLTRLALATKK